MVIITKNNIVEHYETIKNDIFSGCLLSIDCEFSGLHPKQEQRTLASDDLDLRLEKCVCSAKHTELLQFAVTVWKKLENAEKTYEYKTYTFITFSSKRDQTYMGSSIELLADSGVDFNQIFREGLSYLPARIKMKNIVKQDAQRYTIRNYKGIKENFNEQQQNLYDAHWESLQTLIESEPESSYPFIVLECEDKQVMQVLYSELNSEHKNDIFPICLTKSYSHFVHRLKCVRMDKSGVTRRQVNDILEREMLIQYGLSPIMQLLSQSRLPLIVHNGMLDLTHLVCKCFEVPKDVKHFKKILRSRFSKIIDTKVLITEYGDLESKLPSSLGRLYQALEKNELDLPISNRATFVAAVDTNHTPHEKHNAGYDSYMTGSVYWRLLNIVNNYRRENKNNPSIAKFANRIYQVALPETLNIQEKNQDAGDRGRFFLALNLNKMKNFNPHGITSYVQQMDMVAPFFDAEVKKTTRVLVQMVTYKAAMVFVPIHEAAKQLREALYNNEKFQLALFSFSYAKKNKFLTNLIYHAHYAVSDRLIGLGDAKTKENSKKDDAPQANAINRKRKHSELIQENPQDSSEQAGPEKQQRTTCIIM